jgi:hypothetical protein
MKARAARPTIEALIAMMTPRGAPGGSKEQSAVVSKVPADCVRSQPQIKRLRDTGSAVVDECWSETKLSWCLAVG